MLPGFQVFFLSEVSGDTAIRQWHEKHRSSPSRSSAIGGTCCRMCCRPGGYSPLHQTSAGTYLQEMQASEHKAANLLQGMNDTACSVASVLQLYWCQDSPQMSGSAGINLDLVLYFADS